MKKDNTDPGVAVYDEMAPEEPGPNWICAECGDEFRSERAFKMHQKRAHGDTDPFV